MDLAAQRRSTGLDQPIYTTMIDTSIIEFPYTSAVDLNAAMDVLFEHFPDHCPKLVVDRDDVWIFSLGWSPDPAYYIDPLVLEGAQAYGTDLQTMPRFVRNEQINDTIFSLSMVHSRALLAACASLNSNYVERGTTIVHIDDHSDLMPLLLSWEINQRQFHDEVFQQAVDLSDPDALERAIDRGVITKSNFLTAYLLAMPPGCLIHIGSSVEERTMWLAPRPYQTAFAGRSFTQTRMHIQEQMAPGLWEFRQARRLPDDLSIDIHERIWLDVDLDAFCNRYCGDSDLRYQIATTKECEEMKARIEGFLSQLAEVRWVAQIAVVTIAISPGFFPTEYWSYAVPQVYDGIARIVRAVK